MQLIIWLLVSQTVTGTFAPKNFRSREQKYHGMELSLPGAEVLRTFVPWNFAPWLSNN